MKYGGHNSDMWVAVWWKMAGGYFSSRHFSLEINRNFENSRSTCVAVCYLRKVPFRYFHPSLRHVEISLFNCSMLYAFGKFSLENWKMHVNANDRVRIITEYASNVMYTYTGIIYRVTSNIIQRCFVLSVTKFYSSRDLSALGKTVSLWFSSRVWVRFVFSFPFGRSIHLVSPRPCFSCKYYFIHESAFG